MQCIELFPGEYYKQQDSKTADSVKEIGNCLVMRYIGGDSNPTLKFFDLNTFKFLEIKSPTYINIRSTPNKVIHPNFWHAANSQIVINLALQRVFGLAINSKRSLLNRIRIVWETKIIFNTSDNFCIEAINNDWVVFKECQFANMTLQILSTRNGAIALTIQDAFNP